MKKFLFFLYYWLPPLAVMIIIFALSSRQRIHIAETSYAGNFIIFKTLHMIEYGVLFFLIFRANFKSFPKVPVQRLFIISIAAAILYGVTDEFHQMFTPTRQGSIRDVFIDSIGIFLTFVYTKKYLSKLKRFL